MKLFYVSHTDANGECLSQHVFAETAHDAFLLWVEHGLINCCDFAWRADPQGKTRVYELPAAATEPTVLEWRPDQAARYTVEEV